MNNDSSFDKMQKLIPLILVIGTILIGGYLLIRKGIITLPSFGKKDNIIDIGKTSITDLLFSGQEFKLSYAGMDPSQLIDIARFDKTETWQGSGSIEEDVVFGGPVMSMIDRDRQKSSVTLLKNLNLAPIDIIKFVVDFKSDPENIESLSLLLGNKDGTSYYRFPITNMVRDLNYFAIPKSRFFLVEEAGTQDKKTETKSPAVKSSLSWDKIERVQLELISRPDSKVSADINWIRGEKEDGFSPDWMWSGQEHFLNLYHTADGKLALMVVRIHPGMGTLKRIGSVKDFTYSAKIISYKEGIIGLFFRGNYRSGYGYYLTIGGIRTSDWYLQKYYFDEQQSKTGNLLKGQIANFEFNKNEPFWLKVTAKGNNITAYFSIDGKNYTKLGEVIDNEFSSGGVGVATAGGTGIFDDFYLTLK